MIQVEVRPENNDLLDMSYEELRKELRYLKSRVRNVHKILSVHPENKVLTEKDISVAEFNFLIKSYEYLSNNDGENLVYSREQLLYVDFKRFGYSREQFLTHASSIFRKGKKLGKVVEKSRSYGTWKNLHIVIENKVMQLSSLIDDDHYAISINSKNK